MKAQLAGCELKNNLITLLRGTESAEDEDTLTTQKLAADLIVLLLTGGKFVQTDRQFCFNRARKFLTMICTVVVLEYKVSESCN